MADDGIVALREALGKILETDHADLLRDGVALLYREPMEAEVADCVGADRYERTDERVTFRNGYRSRQQRDPQRAGRCGLRRRLRGPLGRAYESAQRVPRAALGYPRRHDRSGDREAARSRVLAHAVWNANPLVSLSWADLAHLGHRAVPGYREAGNRIGRE